MGAKTKTEKRHLMCRLSEQELEEQGKALTDLLQEKAELEIQKSASARHYSDAIKAVDVKIEKQIPIVRDREIEREVEVRTEYNVPDTGKKRETRLDTLEIIFEGQMTDVECSDLFINSGEDTPEDENAQGQKLLPAPIDAEAEEVIHIGKPAPGNDNAIKLEAGKLYEIDGTVFRAEEETKDGRCKGCVFDGCDDLCIAYGLDCIDVILVKAEGDNETEHPSEEEKPAEAEAEDNSGAVPLQKRLMFCEKCLHPGTLYHVDREKLLCDRCLEQKNQKNLSKIETAIAEKRRILVRPQFGYGCRSEFADCTCFRFTIYGNEEKLYASWGSPVYLPGDYRTEGTDAADYYKKLLAQGVEEG